MVRVERRDEIGVERGQQGARRGIVRGGEGDWGKELKHSCVVGPGNRVLIPHTAPPWLREPRRAPVF